MKRVKPLFSAMALTMLAALNTIPIANAASGPLNISQVPLFVATSAKPNVLLVMANSNSMDENDKGLAVGSANPASKSEISRGVAKSLVSRYTGVLNMGLMAFQQFTSGSDQVRRWQVHNSPYDASFDSTAYVPGFTGARTSPTKAFRALKPGSATEYVYYNVNLPFYDSSNQGAGFCYSSTAVAFNNGEAVPGGPWDTYSCFSNKAGESNNLPVDRFASAAAAGYTGFIGNFTFSPTDSDLGQGITDFGRFLTWNWVSPAWFSNSSPGGGYVHVPIGALDAGRAAAFNAKLATTQFVVNGPTNPALPLQNAGLTPLEGTLQSASRYFSGNLQPTEGGPLPVPPNSCGKNYVVIVTNGLPSVKADGSPSADVTTMLADASAAAAALQSQNVLTYIVGFALPFGVNPAQLDTIAAAGGTDTAYNASNAAQLSSALDAVFADILRRSGAASAVALNSSAVKSNAFLYQAKFDQGWTGQLQQYAINPANGALTRHPENEAGLRLDARDLVASPRLMLTYKPSNGAGIPFRWPANPAVPVATELDLSQVAALNTDAFGSNDSRGAARLEYFRGDRSLEGANPATQFRVRNSRLGDMVNSAPIYVGRPSLNLRDTSYAPFRTAMAGREPIVYVGGNDGLLHAFNAATGIEKFAYMPATVFPQVSSLTSQGYSHRYYVDASPSVDDAKIGGSWHTVLVSGLGAGGRGVFALDITDPSTFSEANADAMSLWEFNSSNDADLGLTYGAPAIFKLNNGQWGAIFGNGYNSTASGKSGIFIVNLTTGALIRKILTSAGSNATPNGIGPINAIDIDGNGTADVVYGGDLTGRLWKFDLGDALAANWTVAFSGNPLFHAVVSGNDQPITSAPEVTLHPISGLMVMFGTGSYIEVNDASTTTTQTIYGVRDNGTASLSRSDLVQQSVTGVVTVDSARYRTMSSNPINWASQSGWFIDLPDVGERVAVDPVLRAGRALFTTLVPSSDPCTAGGTGWLMAIDYATGGQINEQILDTNHDGHVNGSDTIVAGAETSGISSAPSFQSGYGSQSNPLEISYANQSDVNSLILAGDPFSRLWKGNRLASRRMSWRQEQ